MEDLFVLDCTKMAPSNLFTFRLKTIGKLDGKHFMVCLIFALCDLGLHAVYSLDNDILVRICCHTLLPPQCVILVFTLPLGQVMDHGRWHTVRDHRWIRLPQTIDSSLSLTSGLLLPSEQHPLAIYQFAGYSSDLIVNLFFYNFFYPYKTNKYPKKTHFCVFLFKGENLSSDIAV